VFDFVVFVVFVIFVGVVTMVLVLDNGLYVDAVFILLLEAKLLVPVIDEVVVVLKGVCRGVEVGIDDVVVVCG
jgi:hypothetical protein